MKKLFHPLTSLAFLITGSFLVLTGTSIPHFPMTLLGIFLFLPVFCNFFHGTRPESIDKSDKSDNTL